MKALKYSDSFGTALSGVGILFVLLGHSTGLLPDAAEREGQLNPSYRVFLRIIDWIYTFHMPLFFLLAGLNYERHTKRRRVAYVDLVVSKAKRLLVPYVLISSLAYPLKVLLSQYAYRPISFSPMAFAENLFLPWENTIIFFWFLPTLFLIFLLTPLLDRLAERPVTAFSGFGLLIVCFYVFPHQPRSGLLTVGNLGGTLHNAVFFFLGMMTERHRVIEKLPPFMAVAVLPSIAISVADIADGALSFPAAILGIVAAIMLVKLVLENSAPVQFAGTHAFQIYLFSWFPQICVRIVSSQILDLPIFVAVGASLVFGLVGPILATQLLDWRLSKGWAFAYGK